MAKTASLVFNGGVIPTGGGASSDRVIHHLFLRELTITELGQEVSVYALLDLDRPTLVAPNYEPVSAFTLFDWCSRGDILQVDVAEALETGTNTYNAFFESANMATDSDGSYVDECVIRVDTKLSGTTPKINTRYLHLSQILDESTSIAYMCQHTSLNDHVTYGDELRRTGKVHFLKAVGDDLAQERAPYGFWIVDLEKPNPQSPYGYDYAMADEIIAKLSAGEIFVLSTYLKAPSPEEDLFIMSSSALQSRQGHEAVRIWFTRMFASNNPEYMYYTTIYTPSMYNENPNFNYPEGRMAILNWRGQQDSRSEFRFMPYTELATVATTGSYKDLSDKPDIPATPSDIEAEPAFSVLPISKGGTGKTTALDAAEYLVSNLRTGTEQITSDDCEIITGSPSAQSPDRFYKRPISTLWNYIKRKLVGATVNVNKSDSNTDTSSFEFVNGHTYHLTVYLQGSGFKIDTTSSGGGYVTAYIGSSATDYHYSSRQDVNIQKGVITTNDIRLRVDWKAENITDSSDNKLHINVVFNGTSYSLVQSNYGLTLKGTDFNGA